MTPSISERSAPDRRTSAACAFNNVSLRSSAGDRNSCTILMDDLRKDELSM
jgi:hypothetical protein